MKGYIEVQLGQDGVWYAAHYAAGGEPDGRIVRLFDTHVLPTPWFLPANKARVVRDLREKGNDVRGAIHTTRHEIATALRRGLTASEESEFMRAVAVEEKD